VDLIRETLRAGAGVPNELRAQRQHHASIRFLMVAQNGVIEEVDGVREAESMPGVNEVRLYKRLGDRVAVHHDFRDRIGHVIASAQNQGSAIQSANDALRAIRIRFTPGER
jgi:biotin carboxylase